MAKMQSILGQVRGMARDFSIDAMPKGYVWDLCDYIPSQRGAQLEGRGPWTYLTSVSLAGTNWGGYDAIYKAGEKLLVAAGPNLYDQPRTTDMTVAAPATLVGGLFASILHNGKFYFEKVYFADAQGLQKPKSVSYDGATVSIASLSGANIPNAKLLDIWKGRLIASGDPAQPNNVIWAPVGMAKADWDALATWGFPRAVTALGPMANVCVVFHDGMTSRIKGGTYPPATGLPPDKVDITVDTFSDQYGCVDPASVVPWQENLIWACAHGVMLTDGSTIRSLTDQGGMGEVWRHLYGLKRTGTQVVCGIYLNRLFIQVLTQWTTSTTREDRPFTFVCDLADRTWYRLTNLNATCFIPSTTGAEQLWFGTDLASQIDPVTGAAQPQFGNRLARVSQIYAGLTDADPDFANPALPPAQDDNGRAILPRITTGWQTLGPEGQKRVRSIYVSHATSKQTLGTPPTGDVISVGYRITPVILDSFVNPVAAGSGIPFSTMYDRKRLPVGRPAYGIQVHLEQILPSHMSRLYDIGVEAWPVDRGRVS